MEYALHVRKRPANGAPIEQVALHGLVVELGQVLLVRSLSERHPQLVAARGDGACHSGADKAGGAGDEGLGHGASVGGGRPPAASGDADLELPLAAHTAHGARDGPETARQDGAAAVGAGGASPLRVESGGGIDRLGNRAIPQLEIGMAMAAGNSLELRRPLPQQRLDPLDLTSCQESLLRTMLSSTSPRGRGVPL